METNITENKVTSQLFLAKLLTQYANLHEKTVGPKANEYIKQIGLRTGEWLERNYNEGEKHWSIEKYVHVIVDIKNSINGSFKMDELNEDHIVVKATRCPFGDMVKEAPHLCTMTSSVFGGIAARKMGYGEVVLRKRIANGDPICEVAVYFTPSEEEGEVYEDVAITPDNGNPFEWEEETIKMLGEELRKSDEIIEGLMDEIIELRAQVKRSKRGYF